VLLQVGRGFGGKPVAKGRHKKGLTDEVFLIPD
jgi:hypothetical protein